MCTIRLLEAVVYIYAFLASWSFGDNCISGQFACTDGQCIPEEYICNGVSDCLDGTDELVECNTNITCFKCKDDHCIPAEWKCNGITDCLDGSDERNCHSHISIENCNVGNGKFLCKDNTCINISQLCNNASDCPDRSDEGSYCREKQTCEQLGCEYECITLSTGLKCICPIGFRLNGKKCEDINECEQFGLGLPEDLSIDWLTGNVYFTDTEKKHIGVCTSTGMYCTILISRDIRKPRGIVLNVNEGNMYWTDWEHPAEIAYSLMDGTNTTSFISKDIYWPNGLALDSPNNRLYWTDAKKMTIESIRLDCTDRRIIYKDVSHLYSIAVFENKLYWSDWMSRSIHTCNKFSGKNCHTVIKEAQGLIYDISIFHPALHQRTLNPCLLALCSDICLLKGNTYACACTQDKKLSSDGHVCTEVGKKQMLIVGTGDKLIHIEHTLLGQHKVTYIPSTVKQVSALTYDKVNNNIIISDLHTKRIIIRSLDTGVSKFLDIQELGHVIAMDCDPRGNNLYLCDIERATLEVINLDTLARRVLLHNFNGEKPESIALVPEEGVMFVAFQKLDHKHSRLYRFYMDGTGRKQIEFENDLIGPVALHYDADLHRIFVADALNIASISTEGDDELNFRSLHINNSIDITTTSDHLFWVDENSNRIYWTDKNLEKSHNHRIILDIQDPESMHIVSVVPTTTRYSPCRVNNNNCSHLCLMSHKSAVCACPAGFDLSGNNYTCMKQQFCTTNELLCTQSNTCILKNLACNGRKDCPHGEDEVDCNKLNTCSNGYFQCINGDCINEKQRCDNIYDCKDKSDELNCNKIRNCASNQFMCGDGKCISNSVVCDSIADCRDNSDEAPYNCQFRTCLNSQFRCNSGACIPKNWECDHDYDCSDFSDEHSNCSNICPPNSFTCTNGKCIDMLYYCDETDDCGDNSDEHLCLTNLGSCNFEEFPCLSSNRSICLPFSGICNGTQECSLGEDEKDCSNCIQGEEFTCEEHYKCIPNEWVCDGIDDCGNNSDEKMCQKKNNLLVHDSNNNQTLCKNEYRCRNGKCIPIVQACNQQQDCDDGSDEDGMCNIECEGSENPCSQVCFKTPMGPTCMCRNGYILMADGYSCLNKNQCLDMPAMCSQLCYNENEGYRCGCYDGFLLRLNNISCKAYGESMSIIFTTDGQIREQNERTNRSSVLLSAEMPRITGFDVLFKLKIVYFSLESASSIHRVDFKAQTRHLIDNVGQPQKLALDWATNNVYFYNAESCAKSVSVCNFEAKCAPLITIKANTHVSAIAVDSVNKFLFIVLSSWWKFNSTSYAIYRYNLDGTGSKQLITTTLGFITGLTYDLNKKHVFYADQYSHVINRITYEGQSKTVLFSNVTKSRGLKFFEDHLYYHTTRGNMVKCKLYDVQHCLDSNLFNYSTDLFTIVQDSLQPAVENVCENHTCTYMCVMSQHSYKCLCENGAVISYYQKCNLTGVHFEKKTKLFVVHSLPLNENLSKTHSGIVTVVILIPLVILVSVGVLLVLRKKKSSRRLISMRFYNRDNDSHVVHES